MRTIHVRHSQTVSARNPETLAPSQLSDGVALPATPADRSAQRSASTDPRKDAPVSALFRHIEHLHAGSGWGRFLDAGTGVNSALWSTALPTERWVGVTGDASHARQVAERAGARFRPQDRLIVGNWGDPALVKGEIFDTVLADYLVGAVEGFSPYFQPHLFKRLLPHVGRHLYVVGLDPYIVGDAPTEAARIVGNRPYLRRLPALGGREPLSRIPGRVGSRFAARHRLYGHSCKALSQPLSRAVGAFPTRHGVETLA